MTRLVRAWMSLPAAVRWVAPLAIMAFVWWSSSRSPVPQPFDLVMALAHNGMHVVTWCALGAATWCALRDVGADDRRAAAILAWLIASAYGIADEVHQSHVADRVPSVSDALSDACGALLGVMLLERIVEARRFSTLAWVGACAAGCSFVALATFTRW